MTGNQPEINRVFVQGSSRPNRMMVAASGNPPLVDLRLTLGADRAAGTPLAIWAV